MSKTKGIPVIIFGDRECTEYKLVEDAIQASGFEISEVISGCARGGDELGEQWAKAHKVPVKQFKADWNDLKAKGAVVKERENPWTHKKEKYNSNAGFARSDQMIDYALKMKGAGIALQPNGPTPGTKYTIKQAQEKGLKIFIWPTEEQVEKNKEEQYEYTF